MNRSFIYVLLHDMSIFLQAFFQVKNSYILIFSYFCEAVFVFEVSRLCITVLYFALYLIFEFSEEAKFAKNKSLTKNYNPKYFNKQNKIIRKIKSSRIWRQTLANQKKKIPARNYVLLQYFDNINFRYKESELT